MILTNQQIAKILTDKPHKKMLDDAKAYTKKLMMHMTGIGLGDYCERLKYFENEHVAQIRKKYMKTNKDLFSRIHRPIDKVFSAMGGSVYYKLPKSQEQELKSILSNVEHGYNVRGWVRNFWLNAYEYDPMGLIFMEVDENGEAYPTYKSLLDIEDYQLNGRRLDYVIFKTDHKIDEYKKGDHYHQIFRVVDDAFDKLIAWDGQQVIDVPNESYLNYFGEVPALIASDIFDQIKGYFISPDDSIVSLADQFLQDGSYFNTFKKYHYFPKAWQYQRACITCEGTGKLAGKDCPRCNAKGFQADYTPADTIQVPTPTSKDEPVLAPNVAGYVEIPHDSLDFMSQQMEGLESLMFKTMWGTELIADMENDTATGKFIDAQPLNDRLNDYSNAAEKVEKYITDMIGTFVFSDMYGGASVNYGRRFLIEPPDAIWDKYQKARTAGAPISTLDDLLKEYLHSKYSADNMRLAVNLKLMKVEPFVHYTVQQVQSLSPSEEAFKSKLYFSEWMSSLPDNALISMNIDALKQSLNEYAATQQIAQPSKDPIAA